MTESTLNFQFKTKMASNEIFSITLSC